MTELFDKYIILDMIRVNQLDNGIIFAGKIKFSQLNQIHKKSLRSASKNDPFDNDSDNRLVEDDWFQRELSVKKIVEIQQYLRKNVLHKDRKTSLSMFPTALLLYNRAYEVDDLINVQKNSDLNNISESNIPLSITDLDCCFFVRTKNNDDLFKLYIPRNKEITLIVDGQHRFYATKKLYDSLSAQDAEDRAYKSILNDFEYIVTFLVGFDIYEVGQVFATVNFKQKPVNRSLYYDIFGASPSTDKDNVVVNEIRLAHILALHLNNSEKSPIHGMIKLLGSGAGLFSQAFFVEKLQEYVFRKHVWDDHLDDYVNGGAEYKVTADFLRAYFESIRDAYPRSWPEKVINSQGLFVYSAIEYNSVLCKTTGLGAFLRLIQDIYPRVKSKPHDFKASINHILRKLSDEQAYELFKSDGEFGKGGSEGKQASLYTKLKSIYFEN